MKYNWVLKSVKLRTPLKDDYEAAKEVADALKKSKKFDGTKIFLCRQDDGIVVPNGEKQDPYLHSFTFVSNDKDELQKLADNFNKILFPNHEKDELLGVNVRKNTDSYNDVFESKKIKTEESEKLEEAKRLKMIPKAKILQGLKDTEIDDDPDDEAYWPMLEAFSMKDLEKMSEKELNYIRHACSVTMNAYHMDI